jgi:hypothetical protein
MPTTRHATLLSIESDAVDPEFSRGLLDRLAGELPHTGFHAEVGGVKLIGPG